MDRSSSMSGLAGLWNLDGRTAEHDGAAALAHPLSHRGTDQRGIWADGPLALACQLLRAAPEAARDCQPAVDGLSNVLLYDGRLDNRAELSSALQGEAARDAPDAELILAAWRAWNRGAFARLLGDFALALFDARRQTLILVRDPVGCRPLYYWSDGRSFVFASEIKGILAHPSVSTTPNADLLADLFLLERPPYEDDGETPFEGVMAVLPGHRLIVSREGIRSERFWDFDPASELRYRSHEDYVEHLRALMRQAVARRVRSAHPVAVAASGGLDSSVVLSLADEISRRRAPPSGAPLLPLCCSTSDDPMTEENRFIRLLESERNLRVVRLPLGKPGDADALRRIAWRSELPLFDDGWIALGPVLESAATAGARVLLTGLWSDRLFFSTSYLVDLFRRGAWRQVASHLEEYQRWFVDANPKYFRARFREDLIRYLTPEAVRSMLRPLRTAFSISREAAAHAEHTLAARARRRRSGKPHPGFASAHARAIYQTVRARSSRLQLEADEKIAAAHGLELATPFLDRDLLAFLMSIPGDVQTPDGVPRGLLRDAMRGTVPGAILERRWRAENIELGRSRAQAYLAMQTPLHACADLGFLSRPARASDRLLPFIGLEFWSREFFSGTLETRQRNERLNGGSNSIEPRQRQAAVHSAAAHGTR
jgi:asparagine synthase (glutamine-hydrolysing)